MPATRPSESHSSTLLPTVAGDRWLLLIHQIPPKPDYLRVKIGRRLQRVGAIAIKNSVYALPASAEAYEDFQWIVREIEEGGGDAFISEALLGDGLTDEAVRARFDAGRNEEYRVILDEARALIKARSKRPVKGGHNGKHPRGDRAESSLQREVARLRRRFETASAIDFFGASEQRAVERLLVELDAQVGRQIAERHAQRERRPINGATWVTRRDVHVDRIASAWLIRRFIDRRPCFIFVDPTQHAHREGELRFDMFQAEYTHVGDACTFETLASTFVPEDDALRQVAEIVHDIDCKDAKFARDEAPGLARLITGLVALHASDEDRVERGGPLFDTLYAAFEHR